MKTSLRLIALCYLLSANSQPTFAQPALMTYQGRLFDAGNPANGNYDLTFAFYNLPTGGSPLFGPVTNLNVAVSNGLFTTYLNVTGINPSLFSGGLAGAHFLEVDARINGSSGGFSALTPRQPIGTTPEALSAATANGVATNAVTAAGIAPGQVVKSLNGLEDVVTLSGGANVTITPSGNTLTIASTGGGGGGSGWSLNGNNVAPGQFLGSTNNQAVELWASGGRALRLEPNSSGAPNVIGGSPNNYAASALGATIGGGGAINWLGGQYTNSVTANFGTVTGGRQNTASGLDASIGGGFYNVASGPEAVVGGGQNNTASGSTAAIGGGLNNTASAPAATVPGGYKNTAAGSGSLAAGYYANAVHPNSFVWSDGSQPAGFSSSAPNTFNVLASGGAFFAGGPINGSFNGQGAVPSGGMILSSNYTDSNLMLAGYVRLGKVDLGNVWDQIAPANGLAGRIEHTAVWTGTEMIIWGGYSGSFLNTGARYNPTADEWTAVSTIGAPGARGYHTAVWTGTEMIVWGGYNGSSVLGDGWRYNPSTDSWTRVSPTGAPAPRANHTAVWTGSKMIIWGGSGSSGVGDLNDGGRYDPATDSWLAVTTTGAPTARDTHTAVWTGSQMTVWGGNGTGIVLNDGGRYDPIADNWAAVSTCGAPTARWQHTAAWTGSEMIIWGGQGNSVIFLNDGGRYNPTADSWTAVTTSGAPAGRNSHTAVWTGSEMIIWGGQGISLGYLVGLNDGGRYNPTTDGWTGVTTAGASAGRWNHTAAWTDSQMIVWGGLTVGGTTFADGGRYTPSRTLYLYQRP